MQPSLRRRNLLPARIARKASKNLFPVFWKTTVAQVQLGDTTQTKFVICDQSIDTNHGYAKRWVENSEVTKRRAELEQQLPKFGAKRGGVDVREAVEGGKRGRPSDRLKELNHQVCSRRSSHVSRYHPCPSPHLV